MPNPQEDTEQALSQFLSNIRDENPVSIEWENEWMDYDSIKLTRFEVLEKLFGAYQKVVCEINNNQAIVSLWAQIVEIVLQSPDVNLAHEKKLQVLSRAETLNIPMRQYYVDMVRVRTDSI